MDARFTYILCNWWCIDAVGTVHVCVRNNKRYITMNCPSCEIGDLHLSYLDISLDWVSIQLQCDNCKAEYSGDIQIGHMDKVEE